MTYSSSVPAAITALLSVFNASTSLGAAAVPVPVRDGPQLTSAAGLEAVAVGYTGDQNQAAVTGTTSPEGMGAGPDRERYTVTCAVEVIDASGSLTAARGRAYQLHAACGAAITADRTLGGAVMRAVPGMGSLTQQQTTGGAMARVVFPVQIDAYTSR